MYEPAAGPVWHLAEGRTFFAGPLHYNAPHQHGAPVFLAGLYGAFRLRLPGTGWLRCRTAVVPAGLAHELDLAGEPLGVLYLEPDVAGPQALASLVEETTEAGGALTGGGGAVLPLRDLWEARDAPRTAGPALADLCAFAHRRARDAPDGRVMRTVARLGGEGAERLGVERLAAEVGLSASRLQHLFAQEIGVPIRRYRAWARMRRAIAAVVAGQNFTGAAHAAGFADQAHFAHDFRRTFGAPASRSLLGIRR